MPNSNLTEKTGQIKKPKEIKKETLTSNKNSNVFVIADLSQLLKH